MNGKTYAAIATAAAAVAAALALLAAPGASAATTDDLANLGYSVQVTFLENGCHDFTVTGFGAVKVDLGTDCDATFQGNLDAFVAGDSERKLAWFHPSAVAARADILAKGYTVETAFTLVSTTDAEAGFHVAGSCNVNTDTDVAGIEALDASLPVSAPCPPTAPADFQATAPDDTSVVLTWTAAASTVGIGGYTLSRDGVQIATLAGDTRGYTDTGLAAATTYTYTLTASDTDGREGAAATVQVTTGSPPAPPGGPGTEPQQGAPPATATAPQATPPADGTVTVTVAAKGRTLQGAISDAAGFQVTITARTKFFLRGHRATRPQIMAALKHARRVTIVGVRHGKAFVAASISVR